MIFFNIENKATILRIGFVLIILGLAVSIRFLHLDARGVHFDEGVYGYYSWKFLTGGEFTYDPWRHGPFLYYVSVVFMAFLGESITTGRTAVAVVSLGMFPALYFLRDELPRPALVFSALVLALHPYVVLTARFYRNDALLATFVLLTIGCYARYYRTGDWIWAVGLGTMAGLAFASKEVAFVIFPPIIAAVLGQIYFHAQYSGSVRNALAEFLPPKYLLLVVPGFVSVIVFFYAGWPPAPESSFPEFVGGLVYWLSAGRRGDGAITYYLDWIVAGTPVVFILAVVGSLGTVLRDDSEWFRWIFLAWAGVVSFVLSMIGDQSWWLVVLLFLPIVLLAGYGVADLWVWATTLEDVVGERTDRFRTDRFRTDRSGVPAINSRGGRVLGSVVLPVTLAVLAMAVVTGAVATPDTVAGLDPPTRSTTLGVEGVTVPDRPVTRDKAFQAARDAAIETECPGIIGLGVYEWPAKWWFRGLEHFRTTNVNAMPLPAVVVTGTESQLLEERDYRSMTFGDYRVYTPPTRCGNGSDPGSAVERTREAF